MDVKKIAERCAEFITHVGDRRGVPGNILARYIDVYRDAGLKEREAVNELLSKTPGLAYLKRTGEWRFWPRQHAPEEAVRA